MKNVIALILCKGNSKGVKNKNLKIFFGKPLLYWTIKSLKDSKLINKIYISSESNKILNYAKKQKISCIKRPKSLSKPKSQSEEDYVEVNLQNILLDILKNFDSSKYDLKVNENIVIQGRKNLIKRGISNIIENGLSYGKKISVELRKSVNSAIITVGDDGPGLPKNEYENVFKPFYRVDKSRGLNKSGVGLGLSIAQDVIKSHGGNISLSESKNKGLLVKISLPL